MKRTKLAAVTALMLMLALVSACGGDDGAGDITESGAVTIEMSDFKFSPSTITATAGQQITLTLKNVGDKDHEFMIGRDVRETDGAPDGFEHDFFENAVVSATRGGVPVTNEELMGAMVMSGDSMMMDGDAMAMEGDDHADDDHADDAMKMDGDAMAMEGDDHADDDHADDAMKMDGDAMAMEGDHAGHGWMALLEEGSADVVLTITVPDETGEWEIGCFEDDGQHYHEGMKGKIIVVDA